jgi:uncharacterized membrane protein HdeD (DUF308 family)
MPPVVLCGIRLARRLIEFLQGGNAMVTGILLFIWGLALLAFGFKNPNVPLEQVNQAMTTGLTEETMIYLIAGGVSLILGLILMVVSNKSIMRHK